MKCRNGTEVISYLAQIYPQLYLDPDTTSKEEYQEIVRYGKRPDSAALSHFHTDPADQMEYIDTPAGQIIVITLINRDDFETFLRSMMAAKDGPNQKIPKTQGASMLTTINWTKIESHKKAFFNSDKPELLLHFEWEEEWARFSAVKSNYLDYLIVLSTGPYSAVEPDIPDWKEKSQIIRKYHECTHFICRKLYPEKINPVWDELAADAIGIYAAFGTYDTTLARLFLGISGGTYVGGRLENYADAADGSAAPDQLDHLAAECEKVIKAMERLFLEHKDAAPFDMIPVLEDQKESIGSLSQ